MRLDHIPTTWRIEKIAYQTYHIYDENGMHRCGARSRSGKPCMKFPVSGRHRCHMHSGTIRRGADSPNYKHGKTSRYALPERLQVKAQELLDRADFADLRENLTLLDLRLNELSERLEIGEYGAIALDLKLLYQQCKDTLEQAARNKNDMQRQTLLERFTGMFNELGMMIDHASRDYAVWKEIVTLNDKRGAMTKTMVEIETRGEQAVSAAEVIGLMTRLADLFTEVNRLRDENERLHQWRLGVEKIIEFPGERRA